MPFAVCSCIWLSSLMTSFADAAKLRFTETSEDGEFTLRAIECAGGCGTAVVVTVDGRYVEPVKPGDVPGIVEGVRSGD